MRWRDGFWTACTYIADTVIGTTANSLQIFGTIACQLGGALFSISYAVDETVTANYFATANVTGDFNFNVSVTQYKLNIKNATLPFGDYIEKNHGLTYSLQSYISPGSVFKTSLIFIGAGTVLKLFGANLQHWQESRLDARYYQSLKKNLSTPSFQEFMYVNGGTVCDAVTNTLQIQLISGAYIRNSKIFNTSHTITYPSHGSHTNAANYTGPVLSAIFPLKYSVDENITMSFTTVLIDGTAAAIANLTYGAEVIFNSTRSVQPPLIQPVLGIAACRLAVGFFENKVRKKREERICKAHEQVIVYEPLLSETDNTADGSHQAIMNPQ